MRLETRELIHSAGLAVLAVLGTVLALALFAVLVLAYMAFFGAAIGAAGGAVYVVFKALIAWAHSGAIADLFTLS